MRNKSSLMLGTVTTIGVTGLFTSMPAFAQVESSVNSDVTIVSGGMLESQNIGISNGLGAADNVSFSDEEEDKKKKRKGKEYLYLGLLAPLFLLNGGGGGSASTLSSGLGSGSSAREARPSDSDVTVRPAMNFDQPSSSADLPTFTALNGSFSNGNITDSGQTVNWGNGGTSGGNLTDSGLSPGMGSGGNGIRPVNFGATPEPSTLVFLATGAMVGGFALWKRSRAK